MNDNAETTPAADVVKSVAVEVAKEAGVTVAGTVLGLGLLFVAGSITTKLQERKARKLAETPKND